MADAYDGPQESTWLAVIKETQMENDKNDVLTLDNIDFNAFSDAVETGKVSTHDAVDVVSRLFVQHAPTAQAFFNTYKVELNYLMVSEAILAHHGQMIRDHHPGRYAVTLLGHAKNGNLRLRYAPQSPIASLLFERK